MENVRARGVVGPEHFSGETVQADKARCFFLRHGDVTIIDSIGCVDKEKIADASDRATAHVVLRDTQLGHHVELPNHICFVLIFIRLLFEGAIVLAIDEAFGVQASDFAAACDIPESVSIDQRCTANPLVGPIVHASRRELFAAVLPKEFAGRIVEADQATQVDCSRITLDVTRPVVCADVRLAVGYDWISVSFRTQSGRPTDVLACFNIVRDGQRSRVWNVVSLGRSAPLGPILRFDLQFGDSLTCNGRRIKFVLGHCVAWKNREAAWKNRGGETRRCQK